MFWTSITPVGWVFSREEVSPQVPLCTSAAGKIPPGLLLLRGNVPHPAHPSVLVTAAHAGPLMAQEGGPGGIWARQLQ